MNDTFKTYHPLNNFLYFVLVIGTSMVLRHPVAQIISFFSAAAYAIQCEGRRATLFLLKYSLPTVVLTAFLNPAFNHEGVTRLLYFPTGNPLTLESIVYGISAGTMLAAVILWFANFNRVITSDKFVYLFGRIIPAMSLILSMTLRFIPKFKAQTLVILDSQRSIGRDISNGSILQRAKIAVTILSIMITWALENAIETADSMKSRGYGLRGRTAFSIYNFDERDEIMMSWLCIGGLYVIAGVIASAFAFRFFPSIRRASATPIGISFYIVYLMLCVTPMLLNVLEERKWIAIRSKK